ncbi:MAG: 1,4-dihydroxy-6-naphthoate synthase [Bacteroidia bacterium]|nr:1,4-dihydroxy-6-naphthoate synthase [Bacteroidia bacterium]MDW8014589.1 1,4-dihydroxy-6-naphthoate synthase [Bacteroidia bacterium]
MKRQLSVAISPCPNDTFIWGALALQQVRSPFSFHFLYEDIQTLNHLVMQGSIDVAKISFFQYAFLPRRVYRLLPVGGALGYGVGPLLVARSALPVESLSEKRIGIPGFRTTAYSLLRFFMPTASHLVEMRYNELIPALVRGDLEAAVIIHESRFRYKEWGLVCIQDLGAYWTQQTGYPVPLGGVVIRRGIPARPLIRYLRQSLRLAWKDRVPGLWTFIAQRAQEMDMSLQRAHIALYVNRFSYCLGPLGKAAIKQYLRHVQHLIGETGGEKFTLASRNL